MDRVKFESRVHLLFFVLGLLGFLFCTLLFTGCCGTPRYIAQDRLIPVIPDPIHDTLYFTNNKVDTIIIKDTSGAWIAYKVSPAGDTTGKAKVYPKAKVVILDYKPEMQKVMVHDTIPIPKPEIKEVEKPYPSISKVGWISLGLVIGGFLCSGIYLYIKR